MQHAIGLLELTSIARGVQVADLMLKSADVRMLMAKAISPGKYIAMVAGNVAAVQQAVQAGEAVCGPMLVDRFVIANVHESVLQAINGVSPIEQRGALGVVETFSVAAGIEAADRAIKAANVSLARLHLATGIAGKSYMLLMGEVADVETAVRVASTSAGEKGLLVHAVTVPRPHLDLWRHLF
ncbi:MAG TPA: BMC domain-containing protein [Pseudomonadales bacterium]|nr:BMC domain-containing protein [Pseudomonadales bacterium]